MYGNNFDYTDSDQELDRRVQEALEQARDNIATVSVQGYPDSGSMAGRLEDVGVGNVRDFLDESYTPFVPNDTPSYEEFMSATPQNIANAIGATQAQYQAGRAERTKDFQNILNDVKKFTYGDDDAFNNIAPGQSPTTVNLSQLNSPAAIAKAERQAARAGAKEERQAARAELDAIKLKRKGAVGDDPLGYFTNQFGNQFGLGDYNKLIKAGQNPNTLEKRINQYAKAGGNIGKPLQEMSFFNDKPAIGSFMQGDSFGKSDKRRAKDAGYSNQEIRQWKKSQGF